MTTGKTLPKDVIDLWPEIFGEITLNVVPLKYLHAIKIIFKNGKIWEIEINGKPDHNWDDLETQVKTIVSEYENNIDQIDFKLDTQRLKKDITSHTNKFLKNKKLK